MTEPAHQPAWYPDPWAAGKLRWHDGSSWTSHVHDAAAPGPAATQREMPSSTVPVATAAPHLVTIPGVSGHGGSGTATRSSTSVKAVVALTIGLLGIPIVPVVLAIIALGEIRRSERRLTGRWLAIVAIIHGCAYAMILAYAMYSGLASMPDPTAGIGKPGTAEMIPVLPVEECAARNTNGTVGACGKGDGTGHDPGGGATPTNASKIDPG